MKFVGWWTQQPAFNQVGMAFVAALMMLTLFTL
jgi:hypothetical protein